MEKELRCKRCVMTSKGDPDISFDENGFCNYCNEALRTEKDVYFPDETGEAKLAELVSFLKNKHKNEKYDCLMGISGGLDSCYLAYLGAVKWGLRIKAIHVDDGFDTEVARRNLDRLCKKCNINLEIIKPDEKQYNALCKAYMKAGVPDLSIPQDNVINTYIYDYAKKEKVFDFLSGLNFALENILQKGHSHDKFDMVNLKDINRRFGTEDIDRLPMESAWQRYYKRKNKSIIIYTPLNYVNYRREVAMNELNEFCGFEYYGSKHLENYLTGFIQLYWLPKKFDFDKRTSHLSSMIVSNQMTREKALEILNAPVCPKEWLDEAIRLIKEKFQISDDEFSRIMSEPPHQHTDYKVDKLLNICISVKNFLNRKS